MRYALGSCFRNSAGYQVNSFMRQASRFVDAAKQAGHDVELRLVWGDSDDDTPAELSRCCDALDLAAWSVTERSHGGPRYGSTEQPERMRALSWVWNGVLEQVGPDVDVFAYVESDLLWQPGVFLRLGARLEPGVDIIAPLTFAGLAMYDIWATRGLDGRRWSPAHPFHPDARFDGALTEVGSMGSGFVMRGEVARTCRITDDNAIVGFCASARAAGYRVWVDAQERIEHP